MTDIDEIADRFRAELLQRERQAASELVRAYGIVWQRVKQMLDDVTQQIALARARGEEVDELWLLQRERLQLLQRRVEAEIREFARFAEARIVSEQAAAVLSAQEHAEQLLRAAIGPAPAGVTVTFDRLPSGAVQELVGVLRDGSPLRELLDELGPEASQQVRQALITGVATGQHPTQIAWQVRQALGGNLVRALTIARTEVLRAYRESSRLVYEANRDVVEGWIWHSAANRRTCAFCWSMHGTFHPLQERMATHPRCRCAMVPATKSWRDLGFRDAPESRAKVTPGPELFARLPEDQQRAILGPSKFAAYQAGAISLEDLRGFRRDPRWGRVGYERSLREVTRS